MWLRLAILSILFYFFAVLQNSFFVHFNILGSAPNLILIFFFALVFFSDQSEKTSIWENYFYAIIAGFLLDAFSHNFLGASIIILFLEIFIIKKMLRILWNRTNEYSLAYFSALFIFYFAVYGFLLNGSLLLLNPKFADFAVNYKILIMGAYNFVFALITFFVFNKFNIFKKEERQLKLL